jgi:threonine dehydrogenase-like Zn-dependent dehydrogenase
MAPPTGAIARHLQIVKPGQPEWREAPVLEPEPDEVLLQVLAVATCPHWDLHMMAGEPMFPGGQLTYPLVPGQPGHEAAGEVVAVGSAVADLAVGDRVAAWRDRGAGVRMGCYAQLVPFAADALLGLPPDLDPRAAASLELAMCVQVSFDQLLELDAVEGQCVAVGGLGPAGLVAVQMARAYGAAEVVGIDPLPARLEQARALGADSVMPPEEENGPDGGLADTAIDCTGLPESVEWLMAQTARVVTVFGVLRDDVKFGLRHWRRGLSLTGYGRHNRAAAERALQLVREGRLDLTALSTHHLPLSRYAEGVDLLRRKEAIKVCFLPQDE